MRLIDADALLEKAVESDRMGAMLVVGKGHIMSAPTVVDTAVDKLLAEVSRLTEERDAALRALKHMDNCDICEQEQEEREMTPEERLLKEIFAKSEQDEMPDNYPETYFEKADYAMFCLHKSLQSLSPALGRISRLCGYLRLGEKDGKNTTPRIIAHNESRMALKHLAMVKRDVDDAYQEILSIVESTKEPGGEERKNEVD